MQTQFEERVESGLPVWYAPPIDTQDDRPYTFDFSNVDTFASESVSSVTISSTNCTATVHAFAAKTVTVRVNTATPGTTATVSIRVTTTPSNFKFDRSFKVKVLDL